MLLFSIALAPLSAQEALPVKQAAGTPGTQGSVAVREDYVLSPGDVVVIHAFEMEEISEKPFLIDNEGKIRAPILGELKIGGQTIAQVREQITAALAKFVKQPQVSVTISQFHTQPIFLMGAFRSPGIYSLEGARTLVDMLAISGGLQPNASMQIKLTRRNEYGKIPLAGAVASADGKSQSVTISLVGIGETANPAENIFIQPYDVITVELAEMIYVDGQIRSSGLTLNEKPSMTMLQVISLSGGLGPTARGKKAYVLRPVPNSKRRKRIEVDVDRIIAGKEDDFDLYPNDFLYIPETSALKRNLGVILSRGLPLTAGLLYLVLR
jgi:polysaccharide biosynthesis/export protein